MSTILNTNGAQLEVPRPDNPEFSCAIVAAKWNPQVTDALVEGARSTLLQAGVDAGNICVVRVPGTVELTFGARSAIHGLHPSAVIVIGCVIRGDTPHFDYVCQSVTQGVAHLNATGDVPVIFGVLTTENEQQALDRAGGCLGNKGAEAAAAAIEMANLASRMLL